MEQSKKCSKCHEIKPLDEFYISAKNTPEGRKEWPMSQCKVCTKAIRKARAIPRTEKRCAKCMKVKLKDEFYRSKVGDKRLFACCKVCTDARSGKGNECPPMGASHWSQKITPAAPDNVDWLIQAWCLRAKAKGLPSFVTD